jgi:hypothetical protein
MKTVSLMTLYYPLHLREGLSITNPSHPRPLRKTQRTLLSLQAPPSKRFWLEKAKNKTMNLALQMNQRPMLRKDSGKNSSRRKRML